MAFVQQTKEHTYKFTGSQRECSFMLMSSGFDIFLAIEGFVCKYLSYSDNRFLACCNRRAGDCLILSGVDVEKL